MNSVRLLRTCSSIACRSFSTCSCRQQLNLHSVRANTETAQNGTAVRPFAELPGPKGLPVIGSALDSFKNAGKGHEKLLEKFDQYGPIFREKVGALTFVYLRDVDAIERLHRLDGKYPQRIVIPIWRQWREDKFQEKGILTVDGPDWKRMRSLLDKQMMRPKHVATYTDKFNEVVTDFVERMAWIRDVKGGEFIQNMDQELFHWSLETIGTVLYETRFGGLQEDKSPEIGNFIHAVQNIFRSTEHTIWCPPHLCKYILPKWYKMHYDAWDVIFATGKKYIDAKLEDMSKKLEKGEDVSGFLATVLASKQMSQGEVYANISELMLGAVDTTSNTMQWVLYELAQRQQIQEELHQEVTSVVPKGQVPSHEHIQKMPYLKAVVKEALRLYPIAGVVTRTVIQDMELCGYNIPPETIVIASTWATGRDPNNFEDPETFRPSRWIRSEDQKEKTHTFASLPFGFGPRMCIGRRVAELEMQLLTARMSQRFLIKYANDKPLTPITRGLMVPSEPVKVKLIDRV